MTEFNHFRTGSTRGRSQSVSTGYSVGESRSISDAVGVTHACTRLQGRAQAAVEAEAIRATLQRLAAEISTTDFTWLRRAVDGAFDEILFGNSSK